MDGGPESPEKKRRKLSENASLPISDSEVPSLNPDSKLVEHESEEENIQVDNQDSEEDGGDSEDRILQAISKARQTGTLKLQECQIWLSDIKRIANIQNLKKLFLIDVPLHYEEIKLAEHIGSAPFLFLETLYLESNGINDDDVRALSNSKTLQTSLKILHVSDNNYFTHSGVKAIADNLVNLEKLDFSCSKIKDEGAEALANGKLIKLIELHLQRVSMTPLGVKAIADSTQLPALEMLDLSFNEIKDEGAEAIAEGRLLFPLQSLFFAGNNITSRGLEAIANSMHLSNNLSYLDLGGHSIGPHIKDLTNMRALKHLFLANKEPPSYNTKILAAGVKIIAESNLSLETLDLAWNNIGDEGVTFIASSETLRKSLKSLNLQCNGISHNGVLTIANKIVGLAYLNLAFNPKVKDEGAEALASGSLKDLEVLDLTLGTITIVGMKAIVNSTQLPALQQLDLSKNRCGNEGAEILAQGPLLSALKRLILKCSGITFYGLTVIANSHKALQLDWEL